MVVKDNLSTTSNCSIANSLSLLFCSVNIIDGFGSSTFFGSLSISSDPIATTGFRTEAFNLVARSFLLLLVHAVGLLT